MKNGILRFIDIHGLRDCNYDFELYYPTRFGNSLKFAYEIEEGLNTKELAGLNVAISRFPENGQESLGEFVASKLRIPSVQIEIARYIRKDENLRKYVIQNLDKIVKKYI
jgi:uncharacterized protein YggU (UPF0235/DUF167 family)